MISPWVMILLLLCFSGSLGVVLSCYRDEEPALIIRGALRRGLNFMLAVMVMALIAWWVTNFVLLPSA